MTVRELIKELLDYTMDGRALEDEVVIKMNGTILHVDTSYMDHKFILIAGTPLP